MMDFKKIFIILVSIFSVMLGGCSKHKPTEHEIQLILSPLVWDNYEIELSLVGANAQDFIALKNTKLINGYYEDSDELNYVAIVRSDVVASKAYDQIQISKSSIEYFDKFRPGIDKVVGKKFAPGDLLATVNMKLYLRRGDMGWILNKHSNISE